MGFKIIPQRHVKNVKFWFTLVTLSFLVYYGVSYYIARKPSYMLQTSSSASRLYLNLGIRERSPKQYNHTIVLLHGTNLDSMAWDSIGTLQKLALAGYRAIAIDLPGHGNSASMKIPQKGFEKAMILESALVELKATNAILVAPSLSGQYALPLVVRGNLKLKGFVPIAPLGSENFSEVEYSMVQIPTMIIFGFADIEWGEFSHRHLKNIPQSKIHVIKDASHVCYLQKPDEFHKLLLRFISDVISGKFNLEENA